MTHGKPLLFCLGANHNSLSLDMREDFYLSPEHIESLMPRIRHEHRLDELCILSTCNRFELFGVTHRRGDDARAALIETFIAIQRHNPNRKHLDEERLRNLLYVHFDMDAVNHIFSVASGLDSLVLGETQITGQFKDATIRAKQASAIGPIINRLAQDALSTVKRVRTQTDIGKRPVSISHAAIDLANRLYGAIRQHTILIVGAGEMATIAAKYAIKYAPRGLYVVNRTVERAEALVKDLGVGEAHPLSDLGELLAKTDIVISSTSYQDHVITPAMVEKALAGRRGHSMFFVDIALPRDIDPAIGSLDNVFLFDIDDLRQVVDDNFEERRLAAEKAKVIVTEGSQSFMRWMGHLAIKPTLSDFKAYVDKLFLQEIDKTLTRDIFKGLSEEQYQALSGMMSSVANKLLADAASGVKNPPSEVAPEELAAVLSHLFMGRDKQRKDQS